MILLDNTVLSNFALIGQSHLLIKFFGEQIATTIEVMAEFEAGVGKDLLPDIKWEELSILKLSSSEKTLFQQLLRRINAGEASCLAVAQHRSYQVMTDDRDARKLAMQMRLPVSGTLGLLVSLIKSNHLSLDEANSILKQMIAKGYYSPLDNLDSLIENES